MFFEQWNGKILNSISKNQAMIFSIQLGRPFPVIFRFDYEHAKILWQPKQLKSSIQNCTQQYIKVSLTAMATPPAPRVLINLLSTTLSTTLMASTNQLRKQITDIRTAARVDNITYEATIPRTTAFLITGHVALAPTESGATTNHTATNREVTGPANLTISTKTLYPYRMGFVKANQKVEEAYHIFIDRSPYTYVGVRYLASYQRNLGEMLAILVSEQTRFNTLEVYNNNFWVPEDSDAYQLHESMYKNFKTAVYNKWTENSPPWPRSVTLTYGSFKNNPVSVNRLLTKQ